MVELIIGVALVALVLSLAAPSFTRMIETQRLRGIHDQIVTDLQFARSEATRLGIPVHVRVQAQSATAPSCYVIFTDTNRNFSPACDCQALTAQGQASCSSGNTKEIKTVAMVPAHKVRIQFVGTTSRIGFDPITGGLMVAVGDAGGAVPSPFRVESLIDTQRKLRTRVELTGRPSTCAPPGSTIDLPPC